MSYHLTYLQAAVTGLVQGVTELFPVSSLGHNVLLPALIGGSWAKTLNVSAPGSPYLAFIVGLHVATAIAMIAFFWRDWLRIVRGFFSSLVERRVATPDQRLAWFIILGTIPVGLVGLLVQKEFIKVFAKPELAATFLAINGLILLASERMRRRKENRDGGGRSAFDGPAGLVPRSTGRPAGLASAGPGPGLVGRAPAGRADGRRAGRRRGTRSSLGSSSGRGPTLGTGRTTGSGKAAAGGTGAAGRADSTGRTGSLCGAGSTGRTGSLCGAGSTGRTDSLCGAGSTGRTDSLCAAGSTGRRTACGAGSPRAAGGSAGPGTGSRRAGYGQQPWDDAQGPGQDTWRDQARQADGDPRGARDPRDPRDPRASRQEQPAGRHGRPGDGRPGDGQAVGGRAGDGRPAPNGAEGDPAVAADRRLSTIGYKRAVVIGAAQILALLPGISRDGIVTVAGMGRGLTRQDAVRFSFLLSAPVILAAGALKATDLTGPISKGMHGPIILGSVIAGLGAYLSIRFLTRYFSEDKSLNPFGYYCIIAGLGSLAYLVLK